MSGAWPNYWYMKVAQSVSSKDSPMPIAAMYAMRIILVLLELTLLTELCKCCSYVVRIAVCANAVSYVCRHELPMWVWLSRTK